MQYYVVSPDGQKYGPVDVPTLAQWAKESRITPDSILESMQDASRVPASQVPGIFAQAAANPYADYPTPTSFTTQQRPTGDYAGDDGSKDVTWAWICCGAGFCCCCFVSIAGIILGNRAMKKGNLKGQAPMIVSIIVLLFGLFSQYFFWTGFVQGFQKSLKEQQTRQPTFSQRVVAPSSAKAI